MKRTFGFGLAVWMVAALLGTVGVGCDKDGGGEDDTAWPEQPADGCPVAFQFNSLTGEGDRRAAKLELFNFTDQNVQSVNMRLHYLNEAGEELDSFPWGATAPTLVAAHNHVEIEAGFALPEQTASVSVTVDEVSFTDGSNWVAPASE